MRQAKNLYQYLYNSLASQIECGYLQPGQMLPSQPRLCEQYNVGITTVRKVVQMLAQDGYVRQTAGKPAQVIYRETPEGYACALLKRRKGVADAFYGLRVIMPPLYTEGARRCGDNDIKVMESLALSLTEDLTQKEIYSRANSFFCHLISQLNNLLAMDLQTDAENYLRVPYFAFPGINNPSLLSAGKVRRFIEEAVKMIQTRAFESLYQHIEQMYLDAYETVERYMQALSRIVKPEQTVDGSYRWFTSKVRSELYLRLAMSLLRRIATGEFNGQKYLPSIPAIMQEYGVMKDTASRAVGYLNMIGVVETLDKKGTVLSVKCRSQSKIDLQDKLVQSRLSLFLDAIQIIVLTVRASAASMATSYDEKRICQMEAVIAKTPDERLNSIAVQRMVEVLVELSPYHSLQNIYRQLYELMLWGYYLEFVDEKYHRPNENVRKGMLCFLDAFKSGDRTVLSASMEFTMTEIFHQTNAVIKAVGLMGKP